MAILLGRFGTSLMCGWILLAVAVPNAPALVNPQLQPSHIRERYNAVISGEVVSMDYDAGKLVLKVTDCSKGQFTPPSVTVLVPEVGFDESSLFDDAKVGGTIVAFVGKPRPRHEGDILLYAGQQWHQAQMTSLKDPAAWTWEKAVGDAMVGTFNGAAEQLLAMMKDAAHGRDYFPARPLVKFKEALTIAQFPSGIRGVAIYDLNGDGQFDLYACHTSGNRAYLQTAPMKFEDRTESLGLSGVRSESCSFADVDADGDVDLLADGFIYLGSASGFERSDLLAIESQLKIKCAALVELNGDGYPDVLVSRIGGGLAFYRNPGAGGGRFRDATAAAGLDRSEAGATGTGFFAWGDFDGNHRPDLYYAAGPGLVLLQRQDGTFAPIDTNYRFDYKASGIDEPGMTGAGCFAPLWGSDSRELVAAGDMHFTILAYRNKQLIDLTRYGNEIRLGRVRQLATLAEDLNADGYLDLLTLARDAGTENIFHCNRGYGSFMLSELYLDYDGLPGKAFATGAWGVAAGDVNKDGAVDLLLGGMDGGLRLAINDAFNHPLRKPSAHAAPLEKTLAQSRILSVTLKGKIGVLGAEVAVAAEAGRVVARRHTGANVLTGCSSPDTVDLVVREPGLLTVTVRFSDGRIKTEQVQANQTGRVPLTVFRD